jgi:hypothetical protein
VQWPPWPWASAPTTTEASSPPLEDASPPSGAPAPSPAVASGVASARRAQEPPEPATVVTSDKSVQERERLPVAGAWEEAAA